jgi:hypothetical protein
VVHSPAFKLQAPPHAAKAAARPLQANATVN